MAQANFDQFAYKYPFSLSGATCNMKIFTLFHRRLK